MRERVLVQCSVVLYASHCFDAPLHSSFCLSFYNYICSVKLALTVNGMMAVIFTTLLVSL